MIRDSRVPFTYRNNVTKSFDFTDIKIVNFLANRIKKFFFNDLSIFNRKKDNKKSINTTHTLESHKTRKI